MKRVTIIGAALFITAGSLIVGALAPTSTTAVAAESTTITLVTHDSFAVSKSVLRAFTRSTGVRVKILQSGDAGAALNQAVLTKDHPLGDVFFGVDNTLMGRALAADIFVRHEVPGLDHVPAEYQLDPSHRLTPVDHGDVCINYDKKWFAREHVPVPTSLGDLTRPAYSGLLVVENPATSSPGLAFLLATVARYGANGWQAYWEQLRDNGVLAVDGWERAYYDDFTQGGNAGTRPLVVSYASSPPAAVYFADPQPDESPIGTMLDTCFRQVEMAGILRGTEHRRAAGALVDFMLTRRFQADVPLQMFVFPVRNGTPLPPVFTEFADVPTKPLSLTPRAIDRHRDEWIDEWTSVVLR